MSNVQSKIKSICEKLKRKTVSEEDILYLKEKEVENFLKIFIRLGNSDEEIEKEDVGQDSEDGTLDIIITATSKLNELPKGDIDSLRLPKLLKRSLKILRSFLNFIKTKKILELLNNAKTEKSNAEGQNTTESCGSSFQGNQ